MRPSIGLLGGGEVLEAIATLAERAGGRVVRAACGAENQALGEVAACSVTLFGAPIDRARAEARRLGDVIDGRAVVVHASRALEPGSGQSVAAIVREETPTHRVGFLTGPLRLADVERGAPVGGALFARFREIHELFEDALRGAALRLYRSADLEGGQTAAAYTRAIALIYGIAESIGVGVPVEAILFARGLGEIGRAVVARGGHERTVFGMSGAGNLFADVRPKHAIEVEVGRALGEGVALGELGARFGPVVGEVTEVVRGFAALIEEHGLDAPLLLVAKSVLEGERTAAEAAAHLMSLPALAD